MCIINIVGEAMAEVDTLLIKSSDNLTIAEVAEEKKLYHVAISRYYYSVLQRMKYAVKLEDPSFSPSATKSHVDIFHAFRTITRNKYPKRGDYLKCLQEFYSLKQFRVMADYENKMIDEATFNINFKNKYNALFHVLTIIC